MKQAPCIERRLAGLHQRGDALLEALIGMVLMSVIGLGLSFSLARTFSAQRYTTVQNIAIIQMKNMLSTSGLSSTYCSSAPSSQPLISVHLDPTAATTTNIPMTVSCSPASNIVVGVTGNTAFNKSISAITRVGISTSANNAIAQKFLGGDGVVSLNQ